MDNLEKIGFVGGIIFVLICGSYGISWKITEYKAAKIIVEGCK